MSVNTPLLETIEADYPPPSVPTGNISNGTKPATTRAPVVLTPTAHPSSSPEDVEAGVAGIFRQSSHPLALFCLYLFRISAISVYILCGFFTNNYVLSTVLVVVLLAMDFWNCRNVAGRTLVGLRYWNQVDEEGESFWVFECRDPSRAANAVDAKMFWIALYTFPVLWTLLLVVSILKFNISFLPIVILAIIFNMTNVIGFTYADRDAKQRWASDVVSGGWNIGGIGGSLLTGAVKSGVSRVFR